MIDQTQCSPQNTPDPQAELLSAVDEALSEMDFDDFLDEFKDGPGKDRHDLIGLEEDPAKVIAHALARRVRRIALDCGFGVDDAPLTELSYIVEKHAMAQANHEAHHKEVVTVFRREWHRVNMPYGFKNPLEYFARCAQLNPTFCEIPSEEFSYAPEFEMAETTAALIREACNLDGGICILGCRDLGEILNVGKSTAAAVLERLTELGVIVLVSKGQLVRSRPLASEWRYVNPDSRVALPPKRKTLDTRSPRYARHARFSGHTGSPRWAGPAHQEKPLLEADGGSPSVTPSATGPKQVREEFQSAFTTATMGAKCKAGDYAEVAGVALRFALSRSDGYAFSESDVPSVAAAARATGNPIVALRETTLQVLSGQILISGPKSFIRYGLEAWQG